MATRRVCGVVNAERGEGCLRGCYLSPDRRFDVVLLEDEVFGLTYIASGFVACCSR